MAFDDRHSMSPLSPACYSLLDWIGSPSDAFTEKYQQIGENGLSAILESSPLLITLPGAYEGINLFWGKLRNFHQSWSTSPQGGTKTQL